MMTPLGVDFLASLERLYIFINTHLRNLFLKCLLFAMAVKKNIYAALRYSVLTSP